jgi:hypothetical protein
LVTEGVRVIVWYPDSSAFFEMFWWLKIKYAFNPGFDAARALQKKMACFNCLSSSTTAPDI